MKKFICLFLGIVMVGCILTACGSSEKEEEKEESTEEVAVVENEEEEYVAPVTEEVEVDYDNIKDLFVVDTIEVPKGSTTAEFLQSIDSTSEDVNYTSYDLNGVDFDVPGTYTFSASLNVLPEVAKAHVEGLELNDDTEEVNLKFYYDVTVTDEQAETAKNTDENIEEEEIVEEPVEENVEEAEVVEEPETPDASEENNGEN